jgi:hypothetical protein
MTQNGKLLLAGILGTTMILCTLVMGITWYYVQVDGTMAKNGYVKTYVPSSMNFNYSMAWIKTNSVVTYPQVNPEK